MPIDRVRPGISNWHFLIKQKHQGFFSKGGETKCFVYFNLQYLYFCEAEEQYLLLVLCTLSTASSLTKHTKLITLHIPCAQPSYRPTPIPRLVDLLPSLFLLYIHPLVLQSISIP